MPKAKRILLTGGGSGGHITPNLAIASELLAMDPAITLLYVGSRRPMDRELVEAEGLPFRTIFAGKLRRYFSWRTVTDPFLILIGLFQSLYILWNFWPHAVFSKGGYVSLPVTLAAAVFGIPVVLHESDARMGLANRAAARFAKKIFSAFPDVHPGVVFIGNPVRPFIAAGSPEKGYALTGFNSEKPVLLVWGGSLGAQEVNDLVEQNFDALIARFQVMHITGRGKAVRPAQAGYFPLEYAGAELPDLYAITSVVLGRAGANSLYELAFLGIPNVCIPLRQNQDQLKNAAYFESAGATVVLKEGDSLPAVLDRVLNGAAAMKAALLKIARPSAARDIAEFLLHIG